VFRRLIEDADYRDARREAIRMSFVPRTWDDVGRDFLRKTRDAMAADYPKREIYPILREGSRFAPGELMVEPIIMAHYVPSPMRMTLVGSFYGLEPDGAWMRGKAGEVKFLTSLEEGEAIIVYLDFYKPANSSQSIAVHVLDGRDSGGERRWSNLVARKRNLVRVQGRVGERGLCTIAMELGHELEPLPGGDMRSIGVGLAAIGYAREADTLLREDLVERFTFRDLSPVGEE